MDLTKQQYAEAYYYLHPYDFGLICGTSPPLSPPSFRSQVRPNKNYL